VKLLLASWLFSESAWWTSMRLYPLSRSDAALLGMRRSLKTSGVAHFFAVLGRLSGVQGT